MSLTRTLGRAGLTVATVMAFLACSDVVPSGKLAEFRQQRQDEQYARRLRDERFVLHTSRGEIVIRLLPMAAPRTVEHVRKLVGDGVYDGTRFHRVIRVPRPYLIQGGDPFTRGEPGKDFVFAAEDGPGKQIAGTGGTEHVIEAERSLLPHAAGAVALALRGDHSGGSQFYIALDVLPNLDEAATVFGYVESGWDIVQKIERGDKILDAELKSVDRIAESSRGQPSPPLPKGYHADGSE